MKKFFLTFDQNKLTRNGKFYFLKTTKNCQKIPKCVQTSVEYLFKRCFKISNHLNNYLTSKVLFITILVSNAQRNFIILFNLFNHFIIIFLITFGNRWADFIITFEFRV